MQDARFVGLSNAAWVPITPTGTVSRTRAVITTPRRAPLAGAARRQRRLQRAASWRVTCSAARVGAHVRAYG